MTRRADPGLALAVGLALLAGAVATGPAFPGQRDPWASWEGTWAVVTTQVFSDCGGEPTRNRLTPAGAESSGARRFAAGELAVVRELRAKRKKVDLLLDLAVPVLVPFPKGDLLLYRERICRIRLLFEIPDAVADRGEEAATGFIQEVLERHGSEEEAKASAAWNGRRRDPYPEDYATTLEEYAKWRDRWVEGAQKEALSLALAAAPYSYDKGGESYYQEFAEGMRDVRRTDLGSCDDLAGTQIAPPPRPAHDDREDVVDPWSQGRSFAFALEMLRRLPECRRERAPESAGSPVP